MYKKSLVLQGLYSDSTQDMNSLFRAFDIASSENFYNAVEFSYFGDLSHYGRINRKLEELNMESLFLSGGYEIKSSGLDLGTSDRALSEQILNRIKKNIDHAYLCGSRKAILLSGPDTLKSERQGALERTAEIIKKSCRYARRSAGAYQLEITLEPFNNTGEPFRLIGSSNQTRILAEEIAPQEENFSLTWDLSHMIQLKEDPIVSYKQLKPYISHIHLANCVTKDKEHPLYGDKHPPFGIPGSDVSEQVLTDFYRAVMKEGLPEKENLVIGPELIKPDGESPEVLVHDVTEIFRKIAEAM